MRIRDTLYSSMVLSPEFRALFQHCPIPMYLWVQAGDEFSPVLADFNTAAVNLTAGKIAELRGKNYLELYADDPQIQQDFRTCFEQHLPVFRKMTYRLRSSGSTGKFSVAYIPVTFDAIVVAVVPE